MEERRRVLHAAPSDTDFPMAGPTRQFWQEQFEQGHTPWDRGGVHPQREEWLASGSLSPCRILVPGCGSGYEVVTLAQAGFNVTGVDYAPIAIARSRKALDAGATLVLAVSRSSVTNRRGHRLRRSSETPAWSTRPWDAP